MKVGSERPDRASCRNSLLIHDEDTLPLQKGRVGGKTRTMYGVV